MLTFHAVSSRVWHCYRLLRATVRYKVEVRSFPTHRRTPPTDIGKYFSEPDEKKCKFNYDTHFIMMKNIINVIADQYSLISWVRSMKLEILVRTVMLLWFSMIFHYFQQYFDDLGAEMHTRSGIIFWQRDVSFGWKFCHQTLFFRVVFDTTR